MDAHDLFRKLSFGARFAKKKVTPKPTTSEKSDQLVKVKEEPTNAAEEWMESGKAVDSEEENSEQGHDGSDFSGSESDDDSHNDDMSDDEKNGEFDGDDDDNERSEGITLLGSMSSNDLGHKSSKEKRKSKKEKKSKLSPEEKVKAQEEERVNAIRRQLRLSVSGGGVPTPLESFEDLTVRYKVSSTLVKNLAKAGYTEPTPIQAQAWPIMLEKRPILACAPTGSGKTAAFLIPLLHHLRGMRRDGIRAVIVSPTRELAKQTHRECLRLAEGTGLNVHIISKLNMSNSKITLQTTKKYDILITTPNRLVYLLKQEPAVLSLKSVEWLVVDESDKLFEAGPRGFRDQLATIYRACDAENIKRAMFSATHGAHVAKWCKENMKGVIAVTVGHRNTTTDKVEQELVYAGSEQGKLLAMREMIHKGLQPPVLIFVQSKERAKELFSELIYDGINVDVIHSDRTQLQRDNVVRSFREGKIWVLICTELMGRGIDFKGVNLVINYDFPPSAVSYIHRIGRTGRAGRSGRAVTFFTADDAPLLRSIATVMHDSGCKVPQYMLDMKKVSKRAKKKIENQAPKRDAISSIPISDIWKQNRLKKRIENTKRAKKGLPPLPDIPQKNKKRKIEEEGKDQIENQNKPKRRKNQNNVQRKKTNSFLGKNKSRQTPFKSKNKSKAPK